ncbi:MAG: Putrescine importer PuuP [Mycobacterium sp.]|nr:Putrescine importer PuuP [Mycobacterium sp.]
MSMHTDTDTRSGKGLRTDSVGLLAVVALGLSSVAPAYSIAVTLGFVVMVVGAGTMFVVRTRFPAFFRGGRDAITDITDTGARSCAH